MSMFRIPTSMPKPGKRSSLFLLETRRNVEYREDYLQGILKYADFALIPLALLNGKAPVAEAD